MKWLGLNLILTAAGLIFVFQNCGPAKLSGNSQSASTAVASIPTSGPGLQLSTSSLNFGTAYLGSASGVQVLTLTSAGDEPLFLTNAFALTSDFTGFGTTCIVNKPLDPGISCTFTMKFAPTVSGARAGMLTVYTNAANSPHLVQLSGTGALPAPPPTPTPTPTPTPAPTPTPTPVPLPVLSLSATSLNFGFAVAGISSTTETLTLTNTGVVPLVFTSPFTYPGQYSGSGNCSTVTPLSPGSSCTVTIKFSPTSGGVKTGNFTIYTNAASSPNTVACTGVAL